jgi:phospholipase C
MKNKMNKMMNVMWLMLLMAFGAIAAQAQGFDDPKVFDANFYMGKYPDICAAFQGDAARAKEHWLNNGIREGRQGSPAFDAKYYLNAYPDLQQAFGQNYDQAIWHWFAWGNNEGRRGSREFDSSFYLANNPDVNAYCQSGRTCAIQHWLSNGISEKRTGAADYDYPANQVASCAPLRWVNGTPIPVGTASGGEQFGRNLYVCRANYQGGVHPGKVYENTCYIGWGGREVGITSFEVLTGSGSWGPARSNYDGAFAGGEENGQSLLLCRANIDGIMNPGKVVAGNCNFGWFGQEIVAANFEVFYPSMAAPTAPRVAPPPPLSVLNYNVMMLAYGGEGHAKATRAALIPQAIKKYQPGWDVVVFEEAFDGNQATLQSGMVAAGYPHSTPVVTGASPSNGGVYIQSRWPIEHYEQIVYNQGVGADFLASKGAMYARINKNGRIYHIFGTHLQADRGETEAKVRRDQMRELAQFIRRVAGGAAERGEPVIVSGDMNFCIEQDNAEFQYMLTNLNATFPGQRPGDWTFDPSANSVAKYRYAGSKAEWLDYVTPSRIGVMPTEVDYRVVKLKSISPFAMGGISHTDLSDHYALSAVYGFGVGSVAATIPTAPTTVKYTVTVRTGTDSGAGTSANLYLTIYGPGGGVGYFHLNPTSSFTNGQVVTLEFSAADIGNVTQIKLQSDGSSPANSWLDGSAWQCASVTISKDGATYNVPVNNWIYGGTYTFNVR